MNQKVFVEQPLALPGSTNNNPITMKLNEKKRLFLLFIIFLNPVLDLLYLF